MILLDTNVLARLMSEPGSHKILAVNKSEGSELAVSCISLAEIIRGIRLLPQSLRRATLETQFDDMVVTPFRDRVLDFSHDLAMAWGHIMATEQQRGNRLSEADGIIAATAFAHNACLLTSDKQLLAVADINTRYPWHDHNEPS